MPTEIPPSSFPSSAPPQMLEQITFLREPSPSGRASSPPASFCPNSPPRRKRPNNWKTDGVSSVGRSVGRSLNRRPPMITLQEQGGLVCLACPIHFLATLFWSPRLNRAWSSFEGDRKRRLSAVSLLPLSLCRVRNGPFAHLNYESAL